METIKNSLLEAQNILTEFINKPENITNIEKAGKLLVNTIKNGNKIIACGNGGSMSDAIHFAEELSGFFRDKRKPIPAIAISDPAHITCVANDLGFNYIFSRYIECMGNKGDVLLAISTSGNSPNILEAAKIAKNKNMAIIGLTGKDGGKLSSFCDIEIRAPFSKYSDRTQEIHIKVIHCLIEYIENNL